MSLPKGERPQWGPVLKDRSREDRREIGRFARRGGRPEEAQKLFETGVTPREANRLFDKSEALVGGTIKRLEFMKWLVEQGLLDEFSVRTE